MHTDTHMHALTHTCTMTYTATHTLTYICTHINASARSRTNTHASIETSKHTCTQRILLQLHFNGIRLCLERGKTLILKRERERERERERDSDCSTLLSGTSLTDKNIISCATASSQYGPSFSQLVKDLQIATRQVNRRHKT